MKTLADLHALHAEVTRELFERTSDSDYVLFNEVAKMVSEHYYGSGRPKPEAKQVTCYLLREHGLSYRRIAALVGYSDHTPAIAANKVISGRLDVEDGFALWLSPILEENLLLKMRE